MRTKKNVNIRSICGEYLLIGEGKENIDFSKMISINETTAYLWEKAKDKEFTKEQLVEWLLEEYDVEEEVAKRDIDNLLLNFKEIGLIEE